jgi:hypothetical protein
MRGAPTCTRTCRRRLSAPASPGTWRSRRPSPPPPPASPLACSTAQRPSPPRPPPRGRRRRPCPCHLPSLVGAASPSKAVPPSLPVSPPLHEAGAAAPDPRPPTIPTHRCSLTSTSDTEYDGRRPNQRPAAQIEARPAPKIETRPAVVLDRDLAPLSSLSIEE